MTIKELHQLLGEEIALGHGDAIVAAEVPELDVPPFEVSGFSPIEDIEDKTEVSCLVNVAELTGEEQTRIKEEAGTDTVEEALEPDEQDRVYVTREVLAIVLA